MPSPNIRLIVIVNGNNWAFAIFTGLIIREKVSSSVVNTDGEKLIFLGFITKSGLAKLLSTTHGSP